MHNAHDQEIQNAEYELRGEEVIDLVEGGEVLDEYIERRRHEFYHEWYAYLEGVYR